MDKMTLEFRQYNSDDTTVELSFIENEDEMNCAKFHDLCKRFAYACGYMPSTIEKFFGSSQYEEMFY